MSGCGENHAGVPEDLLRAIQNPAVVDSGSSAPDAGSGPVTPYPSGPYGVRVGDVVQDLCFQGWVNPAATQFDPARFQRICLSDFHADPEAKLLLVESCAIWCAACRSEYGGNGSTQPSLSQRLAERRGRGFRVLGTLFQDAVSEPASPADAQTWAKAFSIDFPFVADPDHQLGLFTSANVAPFNLLVDAKTMKIVLALSGDEPSVLFSAVDRFLGTAPSGP